MSNENKEYLKIKKELDEVSPSFCLAKWNQVTLHLQNGRTHSCHHPGTHAIPVAELENNPSAIHNTNYKKEQRKKMLEGQRPSECSYCWDIEDLPGEQVSDRYLKSREPTWNNEGDIKKYSNLPWDHNVNPSYIEVSFSNICNLKCTYCSPVHSTTWMNEIKKHGPYKIFGNRDYQSLDQYKQNNHMPIDTDAGEENVYVNAFWKWWPEAVKELKVFRITGGEPLLDKNTFRILDELYENPIPGLEISINTNACAPDDLINKFIEKMKRLNDLNVMGNMIIYTSVDGHGKQAEFGRTGMDYDLWYRNIDKMLTKLPNVQVSIMCTTNIFSVTSLTKMCEDVLVLKKKHVTPKRLHPLLIDFNILRYPGFLNISTLPKGMKVHLEKTLEFVKANNYQTDSNLETGFSNFEMIKVKRLIDFMLEGPKITPDYNRTISILDFYFFITELEQRRGTKFLEVFPEMKEHILNAKAILKARQAQTKQDELGKEES